MQKPLALTMGDPAGIGPDLVIQLAQQGLAKEIIVIGDKLLLSHRAKSLGMTCQLPETQLIHIPAANIRCMGKPTIENVPYILKTLDMAIEGCLKHQFSGLVTGPIHKSIINEAGTYFTGHTEYLAHKAKVNKTVMCFENAKHRMALATTHVPLAQVPTLITKEGLIDVIKILYKDLSEKFKIKNPTIAVCGLNPHAGEAGYLGSEEITVMAPVLKELAAEGIHCPGPFPADAVLNEQKIDCVLSMYHDQLLPAIKYNNFFDTVNITLGLPFIRTSVDHGTALDLVGTGKANPTSLQCAIETALKLR